jgi:hypothetical protein
MINRTHEVIIYAGPHYTDKIAKRYLTIGSLDQLREGARVKTQQLSATRNHRTWVDLIDPDGAPLTHWIFDEGTL